MYLLGRVYVCTSRVNIIFTGIYTTIIRYDNSTFRKLYRLHFKLKYLNKEWGTRREFLLDFHIQKNQFRYF